MFLCAGLLAVVCASGDGEVAAVQSVAYRENLTRWLELGEEQRATVRAQVQALSYGRVRDLKKRYKKFQALPPEEQARITANYREFRELDAEQKMALSQRYALFKNLSEEKRIELLTLLESRKKSTAQP